MLTLFHIRNNLVAVLPLLHESDERKQTGKWNVPTRMNTSSFTRFVGYFRLFVDYSDGKVGATTFKTFLTNQVLAWNQRQMFAKEVRSILSGWETDQAKTISKHTTNNRIESNNNNNKTCFRSGKWVFVLVSIKFHLSKKCADISKSKSYNHHQLAHTPFVACAVPIVYLGINHFSTFIRSTFFPSTFFFTIALPLIPSRKLIWCVCVCMVLCLLCFKSA